VKVVLWLLLLFLVFFVQHQVSVTGNQVFHVYESVLVNALYKERSKSVVGNIFVLVACIPIGYVFTSMAMTPMARAKE
jgi:ABC-type spermidine/putrescine transport system permease subunit I